MRRTLITLCSLFLAVLTLTSCEDQLNIRFKDFYVCIKDSNNTDKSTILSTSNEFWVSYFVYLVSEKRDGDLTVEYEVIPGDGLKEGVDYKLTAERTVTFPKNVYRMPLRIQYMRHEVDPTKDNTLTTRLKSCSDPSIILGYPGPSKKFSQHVVTKINDD